MQERGEITSEMLEDADAVAGLNLADEERELMLERLNRNRQAYLALRERAVPNEVFQRSNSTWSFRGSFTREPGRRLPKGLPPDPYVILSEIWIRPPVRFRVRGNRVVLEAHRFSPTFALHRCTGSRAAPCR